jgi:hypothetical protein
MFVSERPTTLQPHATESTAITVKSGKNIRSMIIFTVLISCAVQSMHHEKQSEVTMESKLPTFEDLIPGNN